MEDIYIVETGDLQENKEVENFWHQISDAEAYVQVKITSSGMDYKRNHEKENDTIVRFWESGDDYISIRLTIVE